MMLSRVGEEKGNIIEKDEIIHIYIHMYDPYQTVLFEIKYLDQYYFWHRLSWFDRITKYVIIIN